MGRSYFGPDIPLALDDNTGIKINQTREEAVKQDFLNLLLTAPGERPRHPDFGCGLRELLFEKNTHEIQSEITGRINQQTARWMPYLSIDDIEFLELEDKTKLAVGVTYSSQILGTNDTIFLSTEGLR